jgi:membrane-bound metal-dependent hydrolase YbcI (DUF457 family)
MLLYSLVLLGDSQWLTASAMDWLVMRMMVVGLILGVGSHLVLDFINPSGIHLYPGFKIRAVPRTSFFATGGPWETFIYYVCIVVSVFALANICMSFWDTSLLELFNKIKLK